MKVSILTRRAGYNYGSMFQAYAIRTIVAQLGHEVQVLNYDEYQQYKTFKLKLVLLKIAYLVLYPFKRLLKNNVVWNRIKQTKIQKEKFDLFDKNFIYPTKERFTDSKQLKKATENSDVCLCGSDQIWNPNLFDENYFLIFCDKKKTKLVAYAPSFGVDELEKHREEIAGFLQRFDKISVRENTGTQIIRSLINKDVSLVLDPTLLLKKEEWQQLSVFPLLQKTPYILCYFLGSMYIPYQFIRKLQDITGLEVKNICTFRTRNNIEGILYDTLDPCEFIGMIENASYVLTDSFHACIFSIIFNKEFFVFERFGSSDKANQNSRIYSLLQTFGIEDRLMLYNKSIPVLSERIDYSELLLILNKKRKDSFDFLQEAIAVMS